MDQKHLDTLEFPQVLARLAQHTTFSAGQELALALRPSPVFAEVQHQLQETREARYLLDTQGGIPLGGAHDVRALARNAVRGAVLLPSDLLDILGTLLVGRRVQRALARLHDRLPLLSDIAARIEPCEALADEINRCISDRGEVTDHASEKLARIRRELRTAHERLLDRLNRIVTDAHNAAFLQEALVTQRSGRYVIPIKAEFKGRIRGIVHDTSASGATFFIEPLSAVEMGNRWRELQIEEEKEVDRILAELSGQVGALADEIDWTVEALGRLDLAFAKAHYANSIDATEPDMVKLVPGGWRLDGEGRRDEREASQPRHAGSTLKLIQARHPLIDPEKVVPIDVQIDAGYFIIVLTGPNTGGKTVSLKTVGLMAAMAQAGLHLPVADGSALSVFEGLYADIGDEQSIEQSLSTFSSHLNNIVKILDEADERGLVLLDELGAGTDPVEGSALARAILSHLLARRITTLVATHYSELKAYAQNTPGVENASMEFDLETLSPTYRLRVGLPGRSNAFAIAERLGLSRVIVNAARELVSPETIEAETLLAEIDAARRAADQAREEAAVLQRRSADQERRLAARLTAIEAERLSILAEARAQARREIDAVRRELDELRAELERPRASGIDQEWLTQAQARLAAEEKAVATPTPAKPRPEEVAIGGDIQPGDTVWVEGLGTTGEVVSVADSNAEVQVGSFRVRVRLDSLERRGRPEPAPLQSSNPLAGQGSRPSPGVELDLRGQRVEEVGERLDKYLDDAFLAGLPFVRIIHGKGTGTLRRAVRQQLDRHPLVRSHRPGERGEGEEGVTVAYLAPSD
jgi:DNA mismatch repair protein MutS2